MLSYTTLESADTRSIYQNVNSKYKSHMKVGLYWLLEMIHVVTCVFCGLCLRKRLRNSSVETSLTSYTFALCEIKNLA